MLDTRQLDSYLDDKAHRLDEHKVKSLVPTFTFTPSTQLLHVLAYHKARMALVYFQSSHGPHKIPSDKELDIQVWLTPPHSPYSCQLTV